MFWSRGLHGETKLAFCDTAMSVLAWVCLPAGAPGHTALKRLTQQLACLCAVGLDPTSADGIHAEPQALGVSNRHVLDQFTSSRRPAIMQHLLQSIEHKSGLGRSGNSPADNAAGKDVDDEGDAGEALPGGDIGEIGNAQSIGLRGTKLPGHSVPGDKGQPDC
jgi:hypothetical protein